ncbi:cobalamin biosynthesis protein [Yinghuangia sp. ASG 101]|uniref:cobalamin biosynthesis protein n=1 Tax=Yinghuangia sp. ASG 101 TaxID=2896848 RepID=UPI001E4D314D|nr:cobalamin biosynthesis protein [Yinghuangia sp. ASG 101]UGQ10736.1 cobalamin biosynthesis protein [Yinghuangia sp. ASG 101]
MSAGAVRDAPDPPVGLVVGVGASKGVAYDEIHETLRAALDTLGLAHVRVVAVASVTTKRGEPAIHALADDLGAAMVWLPPERLAATHVPNPSARVRAVTGTPSVAEAAALVATEGGVLVLGKTRSARRPCLCTIALARHQVGGTTA